MRLTGFWHYQELETPRVRRASMAQVHVSILSKGRNMTSPGRINSAYSRIPESCSTHWYKSSYNSPSKRIGTTWWGSKHGSLQLTCRLPLHRRLHHILHNLIPHLFHLIRAQPALSCLLNKLAILLYMLSTDLGELLFVAGRADRSYGLFYLDGSEFVGTFRAWLFLGVEPKIALDNFKVSNISIRHGMRQGVGVYTEGRAWREKIWLT